ncbi:hypothetical protein CCR75_005950 [Bremia lactucae]|uniref:Sugar phosphate transporter domain-containing protein n=1 Tax=Bremia lactucae TaxID=4779 RepID=A0A976FI36_BRELC|nr:hypothetical protein CCR75_005950 [Bremia lactucae]
MDELHNKKAAVALHKRVAVCIASWYVISLVTLWTNRYVVAKLRVDSNLLSLAQLTMSVFGGLGFELYLVGWTVCKRSMHKVMGDGLKDMVLLASVRILTVLLGLTALKYIAVSFTRKLRISILYRARKFVMLCAYEFLETIKSSAPFFTVVLTYLLLGQRTGWKVNVSLIPIVLGLILCSLSDNSFHTIGFVAALMSNCVDCYQNVLTKRLLNRSYTTSQLQLYTSIIAVMMQLMFIFYQWMITPIGTYNPGTIDCSTTFTLLVLVGDGACFYIQSALAYALMKLVSPVTHSVANCVKRALIIVLSIYRFGERVTSLNWCGIVLVIIGVCLYSGSSRLEREHASNKLTMIPATLTFVNKTSTIDNLSEIRIEKGL